MKRRFGAVLVLGLLVVATSLLAQAPDTVWTRTYGGPRGDAGRSVQQTSDSGYIVSGNTFSFGAGASDLYLLKTDVWGDTSWTLILGGEGHEHGASVRQTFDQGYIVAGYTQLPSGCHVYMVKASGNGDTTWTRTHGIGNIHSIQQTTDSGYIMVGASYDHLEDMLLMKTDVNGDVQWTKTYFGAGSDVGNWVEQTLDRGYIITGWTGSFGAGGYDVWLIKTDAGGDSIWSRTYGGTGYDYGFCVKQTADSGYIIAGFTTSFGAGGRDLYLIKTDPDGDTVWTRTYGQSYDDQGWGVEQTSDLGYVVVGHFGWFSPSRADLWLLKTSENGDTVWTRTYGGPGEDEIGYAVQQTVDQGYIVTGWTAAFGAGGADLWLLKLEPDVKIAEQESAEKVHLMRQIEPNPFTHRTRIQYRLPRSGNVNITVYNLLGEEVRPLVSGRQESGRHTIAWDGKDNFKARVPTGPYFLRFLAAGQSETRRLLLVR